MDNIFKGIIPPVITAFDKNGYFDEHAQREIISFLLPHVHGFYPTGTYGCGPLMTTEERKRVAEVIVDEVSGKVPVIIHIGSVNTAQVIELAKHAESIGADGVGAIPPYYYNYSQKNLLEYFRSILHATNLPVFAYNNPGLSNNPLEPETVAQLANEGLYGLKDSSFDLVDFYNFINAIKKPGFCFIIGTEAIAAAAVNAGAKGVISGLANIWPELMQKLWLALVNGKTKNAAQLQLKVLEARAVLKTAPTLVVCYEVLRMRGINPGNPRLPFHSLEKGKLKHIRSSFAELGLHFT
ncbi:MAG TPA: dihydrodipicolinate synthase family protein [Anaerolineae bacterium]|nr:dihydrodipicolinate synthase family protein [Anaerolineae bacterium]